VKRGDGSKNWCYKYVFHGLNVVCGVEKSGATPLVITAYWVAKTMKDVKKRVNVYDAILLERSSKKKTNRYEAKCRKATLEEDLYDEF
jgi:hypothetical protein